MKILAILECKQKRLRAFLPEFMTPFRACMTRYCSVHDTFNPQNNADYICPHVRAGNLGTACNLIDSMRDDVDIYIVVQTDVMDETGFTGVAKNSDGFIVICCSVRTLVGEFGMRKILPTTTWDAILADYTMTQLRQSYKSLPIPQTVVDLKGRSTTGLATLDSTEGELSWNYPTGITYLLFNQAFKRPTAYTLDSVPGLVAHFTNHMNPGIADIVDFSDRARDISVEKDTSCNVEIGNSIAVVNGLTYYMKNIEDVYYLLGATDVLLYQVYPYCSVMLLDFTDMLSANQKVTQTLLKDCTLMSVDYLGNDWEITFSVPDIDLALNSFFLSFDGRILRTSRVRAIGSNTICFKVSDREIQYFKERDMQLTEKISAFNARYVRLRNNTADWIRAQFGIISDDVKSSVTTSLSTTNLQWSKLSDTEKDMLVLDEALDADGGNLYRSFLITMPNPNIYVHEYLVNVRNNYNSLLIHGNVEGVLQSLRGQEVFEHVICKYMNMRTLHPTDWYTWVNGSVSIYTQVQIPTVYQDINEGEDDYDPAVKSVAYTSYNFDTAKGNITAITKTTDTDIVNSITVDGVVYTKKETTKDSLLYGSDTHLIGYKPFEFLSTLESQPAWSDDDDITFLSTPNVDRIAEEAVHPNSNDFRLLDIVSL